MTDTIKRPVTVRTVSFVIISGGAGQSSREPAVLDADGQVVYLETIAAFINAAPEAAELEALRRQSRERDDWKMTHDAVAADRDYLLALVKEALMTAAPNNPEHNAERFMMMPHALAESGWFRRVRERIEAVGGSNPSASEVGRPPGPERLPQAGERPGQGETLAGTDDWAMRAAREWYPAVAFNRASLAAVIHRHADAEIAKLAELVENLKRLNVLEREQTALREKSLQEALRREADTQRRHDERLDANAAEIARLQAENARLHDHIVTMVGKDALQSRIDMQDETERLRSDLIHATGNAKAMAQKLQAADAETERLKEHIQQQDFKIAECERLLNSDDMRADAAEARCARMREAFGSLTILASYADERVGKAILAIIDDALAKPLS